MQKQHRVSVSLSKEVYSYLEERSKKEVRSVGNLALYLILKGLEAEKAENTAPMPQPFELESIFSSKGKVN